MRTRDRMCFQTIRSVRSRRIEFSFSRFFVIVLLLSVLLSAPYLFCISSLHPSLDLPAFQFPLTSITTYSVANCAVAQWIERLTIEWSRIRIPLRPLGNFDNFLTLIKNGVKV